MFKLISLHYIWCTLPVVLLEQDYWFILWCFSLDASLQKLMILWQKLHVDMKSLLSWQYLMKDIQFINSWNFIMVRNIFIIFYANGVFYLLMLYISTFLFLSHGEPSNLNGQESNDNVIMLLSWYNKYGFCKDTFITHLLKDSSVSIKLKAVTLIFVCTLLVTWQVACFCLIIFKRENNNNNNNNLHYIIP